MPKIKLLAEAESFITFSTERGPAATADDPYSGFNACHYTGDSEAGVAAAAHCGWRGTVNDLLPKTLGAMERLGAHPKNIRAYMGPSICRDCFEVGEDVASVFREAFPQEEGIVIDGAGKPHVDLGRAIACRLMRGGVRMENITKPAECSRCNPQRFFSARALGIESGRTLSAVMMRL